MDHHQMEMEQEDNEWQAKLEGSVSVAKQEIWVEHEIKLRDSVAELTLKTLYYRLVAACFKYHFCT
jgi:hypothetical protein